MNEIVSIYALIDPESDAIKYVGKTFRLLKRFGEHLRNRKASHRTHWVAALKAKGLKPVMEILETFSNCSEEEWQESERFWIAYLKFLGFKLINSDMGGEGGGRLSIETKAKISSSKKGKKCSDAARAAISAGHIGVKRPDVSAALRGRKLPPRSAEWSAKISASKRGKPPHLNSLCAAVKATKGKEMTPNQIAKRNLARDQNRLRAFRVSLS